MGNFYASIECPKKNKSPSIVNCFVKKEFVKKNKQKMFNLLNSLFKKKINAFNFDNQFSNVEFCCIIMSWPPICVDNNKKLLSIGWQFDFELTKEILKTRSVLPLIDHIHSSLGNTNALFKFIRLFFLQQMLCDQFKLWYDLGLQGKEKMYVSFYLISSYYLFL